jgi:hypothetical protein
MAFCTQTTASFCKKMDHNFFEKNANSSPKICEKSHKSVIITSTPELPIEEASFVSRN